MCARCVCACVRCRAVSINQKLLVMMLRKLGYGSGRVLLAENGQQALDLLLAQQNKGREHEVQCILVRTQT